MKVQTVARHLLQRKNKKSHFKDGREVVIFLMGGLMSGIRGAGAMIALEELGLARAFDKIYTLSAGFPNAAYLLSGQAKLGTSIYYEECTTKKFINYFHPWSLVKMDYAIDVVKDIKKLNVSSVFRAKTKLFVGLQNISKQLDEFLEVKKNRRRSFFKLMRAAISVPFVSPGKVRLGYYSYKDIYKNSEWLKLLQIVLNSTATDILIIYNLRSQYEFVHTHLPAIDDKRVLEITPKSSWQLGHFETDPKVLKRECKRMGDLVMKYFGSKKHISL